MASLRQASTTASPKGGVGPPSARPLSSTRPLSPPPNQRQRTRGTTSKGVALVEGLVSAAALSGVWGSISLVIPAHEDVRTSTLMAAQSGACLALGMPCLILVARGAILLCGRKGWNLAMGFAVPRGMDEHALLELYVVGLAAALSGVWLPFFAVLGHMAGMLLVGTNVVWIVLLVIAAVPGIYLAIGVGLEALSPAEGFVLNTRPRTGMWALCALGHFVVLSACFYSPDVHGAIGYVLGFVHIARLLKLAFSFPENWDDGVGSISDTEL